MLKNAGIWLAISRAVVVLTAVAAFGVFAAGTAAARQPPIKLPAEVSSWLERDQLPRWASLLETGEKKFAEGSCVKCHSEGAKGGRFGPNLTDEEWVQSKGDLQGIRDTILWGVRRRDFADKDRRFEMNPAGGMDLEWEEIDALAAYVWSLSHGTFLPQRPE